MDNYLLQTGREFSALLSSLFLRKERASRTWKSRYSRKSVKMSLKHEIKKTKETSGKHCTRWLTRRKIKEPRYCKPAVHDSSAASSSRTSLSSIVQGAVSAMQRKCVSHVQSCSLQQRVRLWIWRFYFWKWIWPPNSLKLLNNLISLAWKFWNSKRDGTFFKKRLVLVWTLCAQWERAG